MTCITYTREMHYGSDIAGDPDVARFEVTEADLRYWQRLLAFGKEQDLAYLEAWDYRCDFFVESLEGTEDTFEECEFRQEASRVEVMVCQEAIKFTGYEKHSNASSEWSTEPLKLKEIAVDLGVDLG